MEDFDKKASDVKAEEERRRDARELQKKMGKALIRNVSKQREEDERARKKDALAMVESQRASSSRKGKPRKSVSFANVPDMGEDESKSRRKASLAWGDTSVGVMRGGMNRARLTVNDLERRTMRLDVVERISGQPPLPNFREKNSDDESEPENDSSHVNYDKITNTTQNLDDSDSGSSPMDSSSKDEEESEDNNFELSQAQLQRDIALEYIKMRETIGSEAHNAMISHTHEGTDEWDQPVRILYCLCHLSLISIITGSYRKFHWKRHSRLSLQNLLSHVSKPHVRYVQGHQMTLQSLSGNQFFLVENRTRYKNPFEMVN